MKQTYKKGQKVFLHCYVGNKEENRSFLCQGYVVDFQADIYRVLVTGINSYCIGIETSNRLLKVVLGKTVPRNETQIQQHLSEIATKIYANGKWFAWEEDKIKRILEKNKERQNERNAGKSPDPSTGRGSQKPIPRVQETGPSTITEGDQRLNQD